MIPVAYRADATCLLDWILAAAMTDDAIAPASSLHRLSTIVNYTPNTDVSEWYFTMLECWAPPPPVPPVPPAPPNPAASGTDGRLVTILELLQQNQTRTVEDGTRGKPYAQEERNILFLAMGEGPPFEALTDARLPAFFREFQAYWSKTTSARLFCEHYLKASWPLD